MLPSTSLRAEALKAEGSGQAIESRRFGVEIEVEGIPSASLRAGSTDRARRELRLPTGWKVTSDGSLYDGSEIVSPPLTLGDFGQVEQVLSLLKCHGARVSERCSVHVHIDGNGFDLEGIKRLVQNTRAYEPWIYQIARGADAEHRGRNGNHYRYCKPIEEVHRNGETDYDGLMKARTFKRFWERWYGVPRQELPRIFSNKYHPTRYRGLNLHSFNYRGTIEFRYFDGILNPADVRAWISIPPLRLLLPCAKPRSPSTPPPTPLSRRPALLSDHTVAPTTQTSTQTCRLCPHKHC